MQVLSQYLTICLLLGAPLDSTISLLPDYIKCGSRSKAKEHKSHKSTLSNKTSREYGGQQSEDCVIYYIKLKTFSISIKVELGEEEKENARLQ